MAEAILVVDDEPCVLNLVCSVLQRAGFDVLRAASAADAMRIGFQRSEPIHLMLCDVLMPLVTGPALAEQFAKLHPETLCLFMAGLPDHPEVGERILRRGRPFLPKPFFPAALVTKVHEVLSA